MASLYRRLPWIAVLAAVACTGTDPVGPPPAPGSLEVFSGGDQRGNALEPLPGDIGIRVLDDDGNMMIGVPVTLEVVDGDGSLSTQQLASDGSGAVVVRWTLGPRTGAQHVRVSAGNPAVHTIITATARPQLLASLQGGALVLLNPESGEVRQIFSQWSATHPTWSPDGRRIAFIGRPDNGAHDRVYVMNADGSAVAAITTVADSTYDLDVDWSPDGKHLAFTRLTGSASRIFVMNPDGSGVVQLTTVQSSNPRWSPDGTRIAFSLVSASNGFGEIAVMNADGSELHALTNNATDDEGPDWSPDGTRLVYFGWREGRPRLFVMNADGTGDRLLTTEVPADHLYDDDPAWSRDGSVIAFARAVNILDGSSYSSVIYTIHPDATGMTPLPSAAAAPLFGARWRP